MKKSDVQRNESQAGIEFGVYTFGDVIQDPLARRAISPKQRLEEIVAAAKLADEVGLDVFGVGEHHRLDFAVSATPVVLGAIASVTKQIRLTSATTVLGTSDPVLVFEDYATLDLLSNGRAEIIAGRGAFVESFPLFGYDQADYEKLFSEKIDLLLQLNAKERITWNGSLRKPLIDVEIAPRPAQQALPIWVGVGGTQESAIRAGTLGTNMAMAILGGEFARFKPLVEVYREAGSRAGHDQEKLQIAVTSHGYIAKTSQQAMDEFYPYYANYYKHFMRRSGRDSNITFGDFEQLVGPDQGLFVGSPQQIIEKILRQHELFGHNRFIAQIDIGGLPYSKVAAAIELLAAEVAPVIRKETGYIHQ